MAGDAPFTYPSNWGGTGLMEIPTARIMKENSIRAGFTYIKPYKHYFTAISPLKGLEIDGRVTTFSNTTFVKQSSTKDKVIGLKYQFHSEGKFLPALAIGIMDPHGTRLTPSQYIVASKQIYPFDFTIGYGNGRFGSKPILETQTESFTVELISDPAGWLRDSQIFGGVQFAPSDKFALMIEFSPIKYHEQLSDPAQPIFFKDPVPSKFNFGIRFKPTNFAEIDMSFQRGNQFGFSISTAFDIGNPLVPIHDPIYSINSFDRQTPFETRLIKAIRYSGFSSIGIAVIGTDLWIEVQNEKYFYSTRAIGVILEILSESDLENIEVIHIVLKEKNIPVIEFTTHSIDISELSKERLTANEFLYLSKFNMAILRTPDMDLHYKPAFSYGFTPNFQMYLNSREGFFKYRLGLSGWGMYQTWKGGSFVAGVQWYPVNTIPVEGIDVSSLQVRSDISRYVNSSVALERLMFNQINKLSPRLFGRLAAGLLEIQYAGLDGEIAAPVLDGRILLGISGSAVKKRQPDSAFKLQDENAKDVYSTFFINGRLNLPEIEASIDIKAGQFLAGDSGARITLSKFIKGVTLQAWYSFSDTSIFDDSINPGYHDKGISISIPLRLFRGSDSRNVFSYSVSPWTRDTQQDIEHFQDLFDFMGRNVTIYLLKDRKMIH